MNPRRDSASGPSQIGTRTRPPNRASHSGVAQLRPGEHRSVAGAAVARAETSPISGALWHVDQTSGQLMTRSQTVFGWRFARRDYRALQLGRSVRGVPGSLAGYRSGVMGCLQPTHPEAPAVVLVTPSRSAGAARPPRWSAAWLLDFSREQDRLRNRIATVPVRSGTTRAPTPPRIGLRPRYCCCPRAPGRTCLVRPWSSRRGFGRGW